jgi:hypothetical protein
MFGEQGNLRRLNTESAWMAVELKWAHGDEKGRLRVEKASFRTPIPQ